MGSVSLFTTINEGIKKEEKKKKPGSVISVSGFSRSSININLWFLVPIFSSTSYVTTFGIEPLHQ